MAFRPNTKTGNLVKFVAEQPRPVSRDELKRASKLSTASFDQTLHHMVKAKYLVRVGQRADASYMTPEQAAKWGPLAHHKQKVAPVPASASSPEPEPTCMQVGTPQPPPPEPEPTGETLTTIIDRAIQPVATALAEHVVRVFQQQLQHELARAISEIDVGKLKPLATSALGAAIETVKKRLPKVAVIGLLPQQAGMMVSEFGENLDLHFISADDRPAKVGGAVRECVRVLVMTGFVSHQILATVKQSTTVPFTYVNGGMTSLREKLMELATETV